MLVSGFQSLRSRVLCVRVSCPRIPESPVTSPGFPVPRLQDPKVSPFQGPSFLGPKVQGFYFRLYPSREREKP